MTPAGGRSAGRVDVVVVGSANLDLVVSAGRLPAPGETVTGTGLEEFPGGKGLNQAVAARRAGAGTAFVGCVGIDDAGETLLAVMRTEGIEHSHVTRRADLRTGRAIIALDARGENSIVVVPGANAAVTVPDPFPTAAVMLTQLEIGLDSAHQALLAARRAGATTVLNPAPASPEVLELLPLCDLVVPNEHELQILGGVDSMLAAGATTIVVTAGAAGAMLISGGRQQSSPPFVVDVRDTTGAGDAFCGVLAARVALGAGLGDALRWASAAGALATTVNGAVPSLATADAIADLLAAQPLSDA